MNKIKLPITIQNLLLFHQNKTRIFELYNSSINLRKVRGR